VKDCKDDDFNEFEDIFQHIIPIMEYANHFKEKLRKINYKLFLLAQRKLHQIRFRENLIRWLRTRKNGFPQNIRE
jgi:hypothetical protein